MRKLIAVGILALALGCHRGTTKTIADFGIRVTPEGIECGAIAQDDTVCLVDCSKVKTYTPGRQVTCDKWVSNVVQPQEQQSDGQ